MNEAEAKYRKLFSMTEYRSVDYPGSMNTEEARAEIIRRERQLLDPEVRRHRDLVRALLHADFVEFGASGRIWNAESIIEVLASEQMPDEIMATDFLALPLDPDVILLTFKTHSAGRACLRSSVWVRNDDDQWLLRFHQGTVVTEKPLG
jgi:ribonuclease HI